MSRADASLDQIAGHLAKLTEQVQCGTKRVRRVVAARSKLLTWMQSSFPSGGNSRPGGEYASPVERKVLTKDRTSERAGQDLAALESHIERAQLELRLAVAIAVAATVTTLKPGEDDTDAWCLHHGRHGFSEPVGDKGRSGICRWCAGFESEFHALPPKSLLEARARGERVTAAMVAKALGRKVNA